jgi:hypothetical protein
MCGRERAREKNRTLWYCAGRKRKSEERALWRGTNMGYGDRESRERYYYERNLKGYAKGKRSFKLEWGLIDPRF